VSSDCPAQIGQVRPVVRAGSGIGNGTSTPIAVHRARPEETDGIAAVIAEAFLHDPAWSWAFPDPAARMRYWQLCTAEALRYPWVLRTDGFEAVSVWIPPDGTEFSAETEARLPSLLAGLVGARADEVGELIRRFGDAHPRREPHYYLSLLGTADAHRGRGLGMALLRENLARIDAEKMPSYLESSNPQNNRLYESLGFVTVVSFRAPGNGPVVTGMWRSRA
jgi:ribosomal protein S18 acetylase RimI-like enzyme